MAMNRTAAVVPKVRSPDRDLRAVGPGPRIEPDHQLAVSQRGLDPLVVGLGDEIQRLFGRVEGVDPSSRRCSPAGWGATSR
jgi:hypothetical protein